MFNNVFTLLFPLFFYFFQALKYISASTVIFALVAPQTSGPTCTRSTRTSWTLLGTTLLF